MGSPLSGGNAECGKAGEETQSCLESACPVDPSTGQSICTCITHDDCLRAALDNDCKPYNEKQTDACGGATSLAAIKAKCFDTKGDIGPGIKLLCGGSASTDGGKD